MHIIHGTWIPEDNNNFIQSGAFYLWVETDTPAGRSRSNSNNVHPRHLAQTALATFLMEKLGLREPVHEALSRTLCTKYFLLPTVAGKPSPSFELLRYMDEEEPIEFDLVPWQVNCYQVADVITALNDIHFIALNASEDFQLRPKARKRRISPVSRSTLHGNCCPIPMRRISNAMQLPCQEPVPQG